jgi:hypothetical protein
MDARLLEQRALAATLKYERPWCVVRLCSVQHVFLATLRVPRELLGLEGCPLSPTWVRDRVKSCCTTMDI